MNKPAPVTFQIEGIAHPLVLQFDFNEVCKAEELTGLNLMSFLTGSGVNSQQTRGMLYACLKPANQSVTLAEAGSLLSVDRDTVLVALLQALGLKTPAQPEPVPETPEVPV